MIMKKYHTGMEQALFLGILVLVAALERLQYHLRETEGSRWWASNGRDVLNLFSFAVLAFGLSLLGFVLPVALFWAACQVVVLTALVGLVGERRGAGVVSVALTVGLGLAPLLAPGWLLQVIQTAVDRWAP